MTFSVSAGCAIADVLLAVVSPNLPRKPDTLMFDKVTPRAPSRPCRCSDLLLFHGELGPRGVGEVRPIQAVRFDRASASKRRPCRRLSPSTAAKHVYRLCHECRVIRCDRSVRQMLSVFEAHSRRPTPLTGPLDKRPNRCIEAVQQDGALKSSGCEHRGYLVRRLEGTQKSLPFDLDQNTKHTSRMWKGYEPLRIRHRGKARFDPDTSALQHFHDGRSVRLREVDRGIVGKFAPTRNALAGPVCVAFDPRSGRDTHERSRTGASHGPDGLIDGRQALSAVDPAGMKVEFRRSGRKTRRTLPRHVVRRDRKFRMIVARARSIQTGLNDHRLTPIRS